MSVGSRLASGLHTDREGIDFPDNADVDPCSPHRHGKLKAQQRCFGCGRTRNEIEIEEGSTRP